MRGNALDINGKLHAIDDIDVEMNNPFFDRDVLRSTGSYPFTKNANSELLNSLNNPQLLQRSNRIMEVNDVTLLTDGVRFFRGVLYINNFTRNLNNYSTRFRCILGDDKNNFASKVKDKTLKDLIMCGPITIENTVPFNPDDLTDPGYTPNVHTPVSEWVEDKIINGHDYYCFPSIINELLNYGTAYTPGIGNAWDSAANLLMKMDVTKAGNAFTVFANATGNCFEDVLLGTFPMFYYRKVLEHCFKDFGYNLVGEFLNTQTIDDLVVVNQCGFIESRFVGYTAPPAIPSFKRYDEMTSTITPSNHLPGMSIVDFIRDFCISFNCAIDIKGNTATILRYTGKTSPTVYDKYNPEVIGEAIVPKKILIGYTVSDEEKHTQYEPIRKDNTKLSSLPEYLDHTIAATEADDTLVNIQIYNKLAAVNGGNAGLDNEKLDNLIHYYRGEDLKYETEMFPVAMKRVNYTNSPSTGNEAYLPVIKRTFSIPATEFIVYYHSLADPPGVAAVLADEHFSATELLEDPYEEIATKGIYHGITNTLSAYSYPYMSNHNYRPTDSGSIGNFHLGWLGSEGLFEVFWTNTLAVFESDFKVTFRMNVTLYQLINHDWEKDIIVRGRTYYVANIKLKLPFKGQAIFECYERV